MTDFYIVYDIRCSITPRNPLHLETVDQTLPRIEQCTPVETPDSWNVLSKHCQCHCNYGGCTDVRMDHRDQHRHDAIPAVQMEKKNGKSRSSIPIVYGKSPRTQL